MVSFQLFNEKSKYTLFEFEFLQTLGCGSFANVKLVREKKTGKFFALKMVRINNSKTANAEIYNIKCEIFIHRKLDHPNIIKFHDYIQHDASVYLLLDYTENGNLYTYLHRKKYLTEKEIFKFFYQTCLAVQYLHENDVLHRDIKPENLLLDHDLNIKLCDFGWATQRIQDKRLTFCGTYEYMAPEIAYKRPYDYHVDIWSLGILLYELIHSEPPFKGRSLPEIYKSFTRGIVKFSSSCHPEAKDLIQKILKQNPNDRLSLAQILSHPWVTYNLCKEEILDLSPCLPPQKILLHSHSLPPETTDTGISARHSRDCEPKTATNAHHKVLQYDTWSEYFKGKPGEIQSSKSLLDTTDKTTDYQKNNNTAPELRDQETKIGLYNNGSYRELNNIQVNPVENVQVVAEQPERARTPSPNSAAHMKSGSAPNVVKTPKKSNEDNNKVFAGNIFSPSFKSKLTTAIRQLTVQTPASQGNKAVNSVNTSKNVLQQINQNTPVAQNTHVSGPFSKAFSLPEEKENHYKKLSDTTNTTKEETKLFSNDHFESCFQTTYQVRPETKGPSVLDFMKPNFLEHTYYKAGDDIPPVPCSSATTRTNTSDFEIKHPFEKPSKEGTEQTHHELNVKKEHARVLPEGFGHSKQPSGYNIGEYLQPNSKKALQLKGILGANVVRYHIPIPLTNNRQIRNKENFLNCVGK